MKKTIASSEYSRLIDWLKESRETKGLSMRALAEKLDQPHSFVQRIETLERRLDVYEYTVYCGTLGVDPIEGLGLLIDGTIT